MAKAAPLPNSVDAISNPFSYGGSCACYTSFGGQTCAARVFEFVRVDMLMQARVGRAGWVGLCLVWVVVFSSVPRGEGWGLGQVCAR